MALINFRNALMTGKRLPYDAEIEFLENVVGAWIDTGFVQSSKALECVMSISVPEAAKLVTDFDPLFGNEQSDSTAMFVLAKQQKAPYLFWRAGSTSNLGVTTAQTSRFFEASLKTDGENGYTRTIGTSTASGTYSGSVVGAANPMAIFAVRLNNSVNLPNTAGYRIASLQIYQDDILVRDYIPVRKGTVGYLYDRVSGKLFGNAGTGDFVLGPDVVPVEYIESHGTEWIDTGVYGSQNLRTTFDYQLMYSGTAPVAEGLFGCYANGLRYHLYCSGVAPSYFQVGMGDSYINTIPVDDVRHSIEFNNGTVSIDGNVVATFNPYGAPTAYTLLLFALHNISGGLYSMTPMRKWRVQMWDNGTPVRDYVPVRVGTDATSWEGATMDVLTRRIYRNAGTGAFGYGNDLRYPIPA